MELLTSEVEGRASIGFGAGPYFRECNALIVAVESWEKVGIVRRFG